jgi:hypothetical protein
MNDDPDLRGPEELISHMLPGRHLPEAGNHDDISLIPLLKTQCGKPPSMAAFTHVDFTDCADLDLAWRQL